MFKKTIALLILNFFLLSFFTIPALGQGLGGIPTLGDSDDPLEQALGGTRLNAYLPSRDEAAIAATNKQTTWDKIRDSFWKALDLAKDYADQTAAITYRVGVRTLLSIMANDIGEWIGSGGKGQTPLFHGDSFEDYLAKTADTASGAVIDEILSQGYLGGFGLCQPDFQVALGINLGLTGYTPPVVNCKLSVLRSNWEQEIRSKSFLPDFQASFDPSQNDIGAALVLHNNLLGLKIEKKEAALLQRLTGGGFKDVTSAISDTIRTPARTVGDTQSSLTGTLFEGELRNTGNILADSVDVFLNAVARSFLQNLLKDGLASGDSSKNNRGNLFNPDAQGIVEGATAARARLAQSINPNFNVPGRYNVVSQLVECTNSANPGHNDCVIDDNFATAINRRLTVRQAVQEGLIRGDRPFGYTSWNPQLNEPSIQEGIPYRSILILRTYRIVPVGWELAARYIGNFERQRVTLNKLLEDYDQVNSPYFGLVDPDWVLVPPDAFCKLSGPGAEIIYSTIVGGTDLNEDGDYDDNGDVKPILQVQREENYCADEQTCIQTDDSGACQFYGYCLEERPSFDFNAASCAPRFSTCATLENLESGSTNSYLLNTVDFAGCSAGSVGCQQYATWQRLDVPTDSDIRWETVRTDSTPVLLNNQTEACDPRDSGCHAFIRVAGLSNSQVEYESISTTLATLTNNDDTDDQAFEGATSTIHLKKAPEWMGCRGCQAAQLGGDPTVVDIEDVQIINGWVGGCPANENRWPCDLDEDEQSTVTPEELEQVNIAFQQGTCATECLNYAPYCTASEVGCTAYTPTNGNPAVTAVSAEQCPNECVGFDVYTKAKSFFDPKVQFAQFIPSTARSCSVADAGCTAFTNLSREGAGGEQLEYYKQIRYCQLPGQIDAKIFYSWEGSDDTGYQLRTFDLKASDQTDAPCTKISYNNDGSITSCDDLNSDVIDICTADNYQQNNDCRQFYDEDGSVTYRLLSRTISVSENCTPLRRTNSNLPVADQQTACTESNGFWNSAINACIYQAVPGEGQSCRAAVAGCRLYQGGTSANYRTVIFENFETDAGDFKNGQLSSVAADVGGHSYSFSSNALALDLSLNVGQSTTRNNAGQILAGSYLVSFEARRATAGSSEVTVEINHGGATTNLFSNEVNVDSEWRKYTLDPLNLSGVTLVEPFSLSISTNSGTIYIDNFEVQTSVDTFAVIENSWSTPVSCYADPADTDTAYLGCQTYNLSSGGRQNIWDFGPSCRPQAVSCEALIDTQNLTTGENPYASRSIGSVTIPADKVEYVVNKNEYQCNGTVQGCMLLGEEDVNPVTQQVSWTSTNLINNPDRYGTILCDAEDIGCSAFSNGQTTYYFKDPRNKVCEYRTDKPQAGWYRLNSPAVSPDCQAGSAQRNFAPANAGQGPVTGWVGLCPATANSCTEYIDPRSDGRINILENGNFIAESTITNNGVPIPRGWSLTDPARSILKDKNVADGIKVKSENGHSLIQEGVEFDSKTLYVISADVKRGANEEKSAYVGLTNCNFGSLILRDVPYCQAIGGTEISPPPSITQIIRDQTEANALSGCSSFAYDGTCIGDLNRDGQVQTDELNAISSMFSGTVAPVCNGNASYVVSSPDNSLIVANKKTDSNVKTFGNVLKPDISGDKFERLSSRVYFNTLAPVRCDVIFGTEEIMDIGQASTAEGHWFKNVSVREANTYYQLSDQVDKSSCGGTVNNTDCVLFNERTVNVSNFGEDQRFVEAVKGYSTSLYDSDNSSSLPYSAIRYGECVNNQCGGLQTGKFCTTHADCQLHYDSNSIIKVTPTRQCNAWLSCKTTRTVVQNGVTKQVCLDVESCRQINDKGECVSKAYLPLPGNLTFDQSTVSRLKNLSGYSQAGYSWPVGTIDGYLSPGEMTQVGNTTHLFNGDFEYYSFAGEPLGWEGWDNGSNMRVVYDPTTAEDYGIGYPLQGRGLLRVNANDVAPYPDENINTSRQISIGEQTYVLSAYVNTQYFTGESVEIRVIQGSSIIEKITVEPGLNWTRINLPINLNNVASVKVQLSWNSSTITSGYWYVDNIQIGPGLNYQEGGGYEPQSCRLFPTSDAPSCVYYDDSGIRNVGKSGYCLVWDPQNTNFCLQWWPVDSVVGEDQGGDNAGYDGPVPLYYCADTQDGWITVVQPQNPLVGATKNECLSLGYDNFTCELYASTTSSNQPFTDNLEVIQIVGQTQELITPGTDAQQEPNARFIIDVYPADNKKTFNGYSIGGLVDKPGSCKAVAINDEDKYGCEIIVWAEKNGSGDKYEVSVTKNGVSYKLITWNESEPYGDPVDPWYTDGKNKKTYIDLAWAKDSNDNKVEGPFDTVTITNLADETNKILGIWVRPAYSCNTIVQAVASDGQNKAYASRIVEGSPYLLDIGQAGVVNEISRAESRAPFGSVSPPQPIDDPRSWDTTSLSGVQPLFPYKVKSSSSVSSGVPLSCRLHNVGTIYNFVNPPTQCHFYGGPVAIQSTQTAIDTVLSNLFVQTYGTWGWSKKCTAGAVDQSCNVDSDCDLVSNPPCFRDYCPGSETIEGVCGDSYSYTPTLSPQNLQLPDYRCLNNSRFAPTACGIAPRVSNITPSSTEINGIGTVTLSFYAEADKDQLPLVSYKVDWGDGLTTIQSGLRMQNRNNDNNAITLSHNYSYDALARNGLCDYVNNCVITPKIQVVDNWGWCSDSRNQAERGFRVSATTRRPFSTGSGLPITEIDGCGSDNPNAWTSGPSITITPY